MQRCERIGNDHMKKATRDIEEIKERMRILTERIAQEEDTDKKEELEQIGHKVTVSTGCSKDGTRVHEGVGKCSI